MQDGTPNHPGMNNKDIFHCIEVGRDPDITHAGTMTLVLCVVCSTSPMCSHTSFLCGWKLAAKSIGENMLLVCVQQEGGKKSVNGRLFF